MKITKSIKVNRSLPSVDRNGFSKISRHFKPAGYYHNRPHIKNPYHAMQIGKIEGFRFILSPTIPLTTKR